MDWQDAEELIELEFRRGTIGLNGEKPNNANFVCTDCATFYLEEDIPNRKDYYFGQERGVYGKCTCKSEGKIYDAHEIHCETPIEAWIREHLEIIIHEYETRVDKMKELIRE